MKKILILFAHPAYQKSRIHRGLNNAIADLHSIHFHDLYESYPEGDIDIAEEQKLLTQHEIIIMQHPLFWYSVPPLLKEWCDLVLEHGWAYGSEGKALRGKYLLQAISTGGQEKAYSKNGFNGHTMLEFLAPMKQTAQTCSMTYAPPFLIHGAHLLEDDDIRTAGLDYRRFLQALSSDRIDLEKHLSLEKINADLDSILESDPE